MCHSLDLKLGYGNSIKTHKLVFSKNMVSIHMIFADECTIFTHVEYPEHITSSNSNTLSNMSIYKLETKNANYYTKVYNIN